MASTTNQTRPVGGQEPEPGTPAPRCTHVRPSELWLDTFVMGLVDSGDVGGYDPEAPASTVWLGWGAFEKPTLAVGSHREVDFAVGFD